MGKKWKTIEPGVWKPEEKGDSIEGVLINKVPKNETTDMSARYYIENKDGMFFVWGSAVLDDRMQYTKVGQEIRITFEGTDKNKRGQKVNLYKVDVAEEEANDSASADEGDEGDEPVDLEEIEDVK